MIKDDGGAAFPRPMSFTLNQEGIWDQTGMSLRVYIAIHAPEPSAEEIKFEGERDRLANPHNDNYKPLRRSRLQIIADLKFAYADAIIERMN